MRKMHIFQGRETSAMRSGLNPVQQSKPFSSIPWCTSTELPVSSGDGIWGTQHDLEKTCVTWQYLIEADHLAWPTGLTPGEDLIYGKWHGFNHSPENGEWRSTSAAHCGSAELARSHWLWEHTHWVIHTIKELPILPTLMKCISVLLVALSSNPFRLFCCSHHPKVWAHHSWWTAGLQLRLKGKPGSK